MTNKQKNRTQLYIFVVLVILVVLFILFRVGTYGKIDSKKDFTNIQKTQNESLKNEYYDFILKNLQSGGPGKDGIPSIDEPKYLNANNTKLNDNDIIYGINHKGFIAAYPKRILNWHEIVNDEIDGEKISVTFCPLTGTAIGFKGKNLGVSGKLFNSNLVMYDRETDSYIPQMLGVGISHNLKGVELDKINVETTTWKLWKEKYPKTKVLSFDTNYNRDYSKSPYGNYDISSRVMFPVQNQNDTLFEKEIVLGVMNNGEHIAIVKNNFKEKYPDGLEYTLGQETFKFTYNVELGIIESNKEVVNYESFWFAWIAFFPQTQIIG